jgi:hypothetical protein
MIPGGVAFQPGQDDPQKRLQNGESRTNGSPEGVQEAIKVLSLRLPKVVGAQASVPTPLLKSDGAAGNSRVDSIVAQVMQKYFPTDSPQSGQVPTMTADATPQEAASYKPPAQAQNPWSSLPRIIVDLPRPGTLPELPGIGGPSRPGAPTWDGGSNGPGPGSGMNPGVGGQPLPDLRQQLDWLPPRGGYDAPDVPLI